VIFKKTGRVICWVIECLGALVASAGVVYLYVSCLSWLKFGVWPSYDLQMFWAAVHSQWPHMEWTGLQKIIGLVPAVILGLPTWVVFLIAGGSVYIVGILGNLGLDVRVTRTPSWVIISVRWASTVVLQVSGPGGGRGTGKRPPFAGRSLAMERESACRLGAAPPLKASCRRHDAKRSGSSPALASQPTGYLRRGTGRV